MARDNEPGQAKQAGKKRSESKWTKYQPAPRENQCSWDEVSSSMIGEIVGAVTRGGDAILFGTTQDGGALVITICSGSERIKFYGSTEAEISTMMQRVLAAATD